MLRRTFLRLVSMVPLVGSLPVVGKQRCPKVTYISHFVPPNGHKEDTFVATLTDWRTDKDSGVGVRVTFNDGSSIHAKSLEKDVTNTAKDVIYLQENNFRNEDQIFVYLFYTDNEHCAVFFTTGEF